MKAGWQDILDSIATALHTDSVLITSPPVLLVIFGVAIALYLVIKLLINRAGFSPSATDSLGNQMEQSGGLPANRAPNSQTGRVGIREGSTKFAAKKEQMVVRMKSGALQKAQSLLATGTDMDSICREINPEYASWESRKQQVFQKTMEAVIKSKS